ncbi:MAG: transglutaminase family protein [Leptospiraceae bacterium]|nr:transglutaminase family protein [Leptospiraceae bacterium]
MAAGESIRQKKIEFLLTCLAESETTANAVESERIIREHLLALLPFGRHPAFYMESIPDAAIRLRLREHHIDSLNEWKLRHDWNALIHRSNEDRDVDLESGAFLIARLGPRVDIDFCAFTEALDAMAAWLRSRLQAIPEDAHSDRLDAFRRFFYEEEGFNGNTTNYYDPANSYLTAVLETRKGIPVSLSVLALLLARRVDFPLSGVNLPGHFIIKYRAPGLQIYLDPFNEGSYLTEEDCLNFLTRQGLEASALYLSRCSSVSILKRMYRNLINYHSGAGDTAREKLLREHLALLEGCSIRS